MSDPTGDMQPIREGSPAALLPLQRALGEAGITATIVPAGGHSRGG